MFLVKPLMENVSSNAAADVSTVPMTVSVQVPPKENRIQSDASGIPCRMHV